MTEYGGDSFSYEDPLLQRDKGWDSPSAWDSATGAPGISGMDGLAQGLSSETTIDPELEVASWDLMVKHGQYHATNAGKVHPYGEASPQEIPDKNLGEDLWDKAKEDVKDMGQDMKQALDDFSHEVNQEKYSEK